MQITAKLNGQVVYKSAPLSAIAKATQALLSPTAEDLKLSLRERIGIFEALAKSVPQIDIPVKHKFIEGLYRREVTFPKGFLGTGKIHLKSHMDEMITGEMLVVTENGVVHLKAPCSLITVPGKKKFGYALTEVTWVTFHPTSCTTVEAVEAEIMCSDWEDYEIEGESFEAMVNKLGFTVDAVRAMSENTDDYLDFIDERLQLDNSKIEGTGVIACYDLLVGDSFLARTHDGKRTAVGRYTNHSNTPNCVMREGVKSIMLEVSKPVSKGEELTCDYRVSVALARSLSCQV